ncbi:SDR family NAD(P)-dependent oxidoreductase [Aerococcus kribbianus]|uniref:Glucose 1-dehydrogenase n=1 Tax=Aerococcus kribbianus TaxID=2999064 RepID=A0A9X3FLR5_9LACT|nr:MULTISPECIES: glucose 1-dehydrogenase [unclassified Aerococcus]MCZ0716820.1 glucose 1-dehydrogenase [Aerococcus sp. YH-aer221]MCZ0725108.1 glucose 1-dehydrogenase [Aerococcus sp. YH-aer222]
MGRVQDKVVLITGGGSGIGAASAKLLAKEGAQVIITGRTQEKLDNVKADNDQIHTIQQDVTKAEDWDRVITEIKEKYGHLDGLVNNAGITGPEEGSIEDLTDETFYQIIDTNIYSVYKGMQVAIPLMREAGKGSIVNISSTSGLVGTPDAAAYGASKFAVRGLTQSAALELVDDHIRVNSVHPGVVETEIRLFEEVVETTPMKRVGKAEEIAYLVLYLISDESTFSTGAAFTADGGYTAK